MRVSSFALQYSDINMT